jgi:hypothetical protein
MDQEKYKAAADALAGGSGPVPQIWAPDGSKPIESREEFLQWYPGYKEYFEQMDVRTFLDKWPELHALAKKKGIIHAVAHDPDTDRWSINLTQRWNGVPVAHIEFPWDANLADQFDKAFEFLNKQEDILKQVK